MTHSEFSQPSIATLFTMLFFALGFFVTGMLIHVVRVHVQDEQNMIGDSFLWSQATDKTNVQTELLRRIDSAKKSILQKENIISRNEYRIIYPPFKAITSPNIDSRSILQLMEFIEFRTLLDIVEEWNPDNVEMPALYNGQFRETLQHFNYSNQEERRMAQIYRDAELPFKLYDVPDVQRVMNTWSYQYLKKNINTMNVQPHVEASSNNHFLYWNYRSSSKQSFESFDDGKESKTSKKVTTPTTLVDLSFEDWHTIATDSDQRHLNSSTSHYYYMIGTSRDDKNNFINNDLNFFSTEEENFFITNVEANKGIQCRFGMRGIIAESHYDSGRNMVGMFKGSKRYILAPPPACDKLGIISDPQHPSYRHSVIDWSDLGQARTYGFGGVPAIDTIVQQGEVLYIPSFWFHYIVSLEYSIQCNSRSGISEASKDVEILIEKCLQPDIKDTANIMNKEKLLNGKLRKNKNRTKGKDSKSKLQKQLQDKKKSQRGGKVSHIQ